MPDYLRRYAELAEQGLSDEEVAERLGVSKTTIKQRYKYEYRKYIQEAARMLAEGASEDEVREKLGVTDAMLREAIQLAYQIMKERSGGEEARESVERALKEAMGEEAGGEKAGVEEDVVSKVERMINTIERIKRLVSTPVARAPAPPSPSLPPPPGQAPAQQQIISELEALKSELAALKSSVAQQVYLGRVKELEVRHPDGRIEIYRYGLKPDDSAKLYVVKSRAEIQKKQAETVLNKVLPDALNELKGIRSDLRTIGERLLGILESQVIPRVSRIHPALSSTVPVTFRTPEQREAELRELSNRLGVKVEEGGGER